MKSVIKSARKLLVSTLAGVTAALATSLAHATEPCGDLGECKVLIEITASDGDIGFHFLADGDDLEALTLREPKSQGTGIGKKIFEYNSHGTLREQTVTETFVESAEPLCYDPALDDDPDNDDEDFVTLAEFLERWPIGTYTFRARNSDKEKLQSQTELTNLIPAAPADVDFDPDTGVISWNAGDDLGAGREAAYGLDAEFQMLLDDGAIVLVTAPDAWEVVLQPDFDPESDEAVFNNLTFTAHLPGDTPLPAAVTVPAEYLAALPANTPVTMEVGAIAGGDNATFTEEGGFCVNGDECGD